MGDGAMCHYCRRYQCICSNEKDVVTLFLGGDTVNSIALTLDMEMDAVEASLRKTIANFMLQKPVHQP